MTQKKIVPFSERHRYVRRTMQIESMDTALKNGLWNTFTRHAWIQYPTVRDHRPMERFCKKLWVEHFKQTDDAFYKAYRGDALGHNWGNLRFKIQQWFENNCWYEVYDFVEFVGKHNPHGGSSSFREACNLVLERERAGYRFMNGLIAPITNDLEIETIESAIEGRKEPADHLRDALRMLSDRQAPNYRDSLENSIKAVESQARITLRATDTLGH